MQTYPDGVPPGAGDDPPYDTAFQFHILAAATPLTTAEFIAPADPGGGHAAGGDPRRPHGLVRAPGPGVRPDRVDRHLPGRPDPGGRAPARGRAAVGPPRSRGPDRDVHPGRGHPGRPGRAADRHRRQPRRLLRPGPPVVRRYPDPDAPTRAPGSSTAPTTMPRATSSPASPRRPATINLQQASPTHYEAFNVYVNYSNDYDQDGDVDSSNPENPNYVPVQPPNFSPFFTAAGAAGQDQMIGPYGYGSEDYVPVGQPLPYTVEFTNPSTTSTVGQIRIVSQLDPNLDPRSFRLGDLQIGDLDVHVPDTVGSFQGDFDFTQTKGFILRVSARDRHPVGDDHLALAGDRPADRRGRAGPDARAPGPGQRRLGLRHLHRRAARRPGDRDDDQRPGAGSCSTPRPRRTPTRSPTRSTRWLPPRR